jgi:hypothetical protein
MLIESGAEHAVPQGGAYAEAFMIVFVMMQVMIAPQCLHPFEGRRPCMYGVVHAGIYQVAQYKARPEYEGDMAHQYPEYEEQRAGYQYAGHWGHKQPLFIPRIMVMITVQGIRKFPDAFAGADPVKQVTVRHVFKEGPAEYCSEEYGGDFCGRILQVAGAVIYHPGYNRRVHSPDNQGMCFGEHFKVTVAEKLRLSFVLNFFKLHNTILIIKRISMEQKWALAADLPPIFRRVAE